MNIEKPSFKKICLMHLQALTNFPYIEKDFDAITDYELLCKVVDYLNQVIANENEQNKTVLELYNAFNYLKSYVENYFENLDVQDEINNKLDEMVEDGVLEQIIEQYINSTAVWCFDTLVALKSATNLINGSYARTLGYYAVNDGGEGLYKITDTESETEYQEELNSGLYATLIIENNTVNVKQFGAKGDGNNDDTQSIQNALNSIADRIYLAEGNYLITSTLTMPLNKTLYGTNANTCVLKVTNFDNYALKYGESHHYGSKRGKIEDIRIESINDNVNYTYGIYVNSGCEIRNVYLNKLKQAISKPNSYIDNLILYRCHIMYCGGKSESYVVDLPGNGDAVLISQCQFGTAYTSETYSNYLGIRITGSTGVLLINNIINAPITINNSVATLINNHMEGPSTIQHFNLSNIMISNSHVDIDTLFIHKCLNKPEIAIQLETPNEGHNAQVSLKNITIQLTSLMFSEYQNMSECYNVYVGNQSIVKIDNVGNSLNYTAGWASIFPITGIIVKDSNGLLEDFNKISSLASIHSVISMNKVFVDNLLPIETSATNNSLQYSNTNNYTPWFESGYNNSTIYYRKVSCYDFNRKLACSISSEKSITGITSYANDSSIGKGGSIGNTGSFMNQTVGCGLLDIIYRGDETGVYNKITKVPVCSARSLYDFGTHICGHPTESRTSGNIDDFNIVSNFKRIGNNVEFTSSSTPSYGTFLKGDRCINSSIASGNIKSWIYDGTNWLSEGTY